MRHGSAKQHSGSMVRRSYVKEGSALFWLLTLYHNVKFALFALLLRIFGLPDLATKLWEGWQVNFPLFRLYPT